MSTEVHVFQIGPDGTEYYAARSADEMKEWYAKTADTFEEDLRDHFEEIDDIDTEFYFNDDGIVSKKTWRKLALECAELPCQISTGYY